MKLFLINFILLNCMLNLTASAYEWNQVTPDGIVNKSVNYKTPQSAKNGLFADISLKTKILSSKEINKYFPNYTNPKSILIIGDTGCRLKEGKLGSEYQDCNDKKLWPFWSVTESAEKENPDLIIHLGDYLYREKCSAGRPCEKMSQAVGYELRPWELDFFEPMKKLLDKTPMITVRGNHEDCNRAFFGYKQMLSNSQWPKDCLDYEPPQIIVLGDTAIINFDSSSISEIPSLLKSDESLWVSRLNEISEQLNKIKARNIWLITHKPIYGIITFKSALIPGNINLRSYFEKSQLKDKVTNIFGGHIHTSMIVTPKKYAKQIIIGNSGTQLEKFKEQISKNNLDLFSYESAKLVSTEFGYGIAKKNSDNKWVMIFKDASGKELFKELL